MLYSEKYTKRETIQSKKSLMVDKIFSGNTIYNRKVLCKVKYYERKYSPGKKKYEVIIRIYIFFAPQTAEILLSSSSSRKSFSFKPIQHQYLCLLRSSSYIIKTVTSTSTVAKIVLIFSTTTVVT